MKKFEKLGCENNGKDQFKLVFNINLVADQPKMHIKELSLKELKREKKSKTLLGSKQGLENITVSNVIKEVNKPP